MNLQSFVPVILSLLFATFGWRIAREIAVGDQGRKTWLLFADYLNFLSLVSVLIFCIVIPLKTDTFGTASRVTMAVSFVFIVLYPIILAGHYRLFSKKGRSIYEEKGSDYPWVTDQEAILIVIALVSAVIAGWYVAQ
jgi:hypothetical protein